MARKLYPIGIQTFERIRKEDKFYVDKTEYLYRMTHTNGTYFFLSRPRRFGKSLLVSTFKSYFEGRKELFEGLAIDKLEKEWTEYPVLHFDMSLGKHMEKEQLERYLLHIIEEQERKFGKSVAEALAQIEKKHYADAFKTKDKPVVKVGLNFGLKDQVNTLEWEISQR